MPCCCLVAQLCPTFVTPWTLARQAPLSIGLLRQEHWSGLPFPLPEILPTQGLNSCLLHWQVNSLPLSHQGLISFRMDWLDLLAVQGTLKSLLQHHSSKASILQCSVFFIVQLSHLYMTTGKTIALTRWPFV